MKDGNFPPPLPSTIIFQREKTVQVGENSARGGKTCFLSRIDS